LWFRAFWCAGWLQADGANGVGRSIKMSKMVAALVVCPLMAAAVPAASAQEWTLDARGTLAGGAMDDDSALAPADSGPLFDGSVVVTQTTDFSNGLRMEWRGEVRLQKDAQSRPAFAGVLGDCTATAAGCASVAGTLSPVSPSTGLASAGGRADEDGFATIEGASLALSGSWGEGIVGLDTGAAARLDARAPTVLQSVSAFTSSLDPSGLVTTRARNDVTGSSFKATYMSPRWIGFRLGASWTPEADHRSADFDPRFDDVPGLAGAELKNVFEGAISFARQFREADIRVRAALTATVAESGSPYAEFGGYEAWGAGLELEKAGWTGGVRWLGGNNAWAAGSGDYEAVEAGLTRASGPWTFGVEAGWSRDDLLRTEGLSGLVAARRTFGEHLDLGVGYLHAEADLPQASPGFGLIEARNSGLIVELTVRN